MDLFNRKFTSQEASALTGAEAKHIQNWANRGLIVGQSDGGKGKPRLYSFNNVMEIAIASAMMDSADVGPEAAFNGSRWFSHVGHGKGEGYVGDPDETETHERHPGFPYHWSAGDTFLIVGKKIAFVRAIEIGRDNFSKVTYGAGSSFHVVNVSDLFNLMCARLGIHPNVVLDEAYPEEAA